MSAIAYTPFLTNSAAFKKTSSSIPSPFCLPSLTSSSTILSRLMIFWDETSPITAAPIASPTNPVWSSLFFLYFLITSSACSNGLSVNRDVGCSYLAITLSSLYKTVSFFLTAGKWSVSSITSFLGSDSAPRSSVRSGSSLSVVDLDLCRL